MDPQLAVQRANFLHHFEETQRTIEVEWPQISLRPGGAFSGRVQCQHSFGRTFTGF